MINVYEKESNGRTLRFIHLSTVNIHRGPRVIYRGVLLDNNFHSQEVNMNPDKMVSRGWKKIPDPLTRLKEKMLSDITDLNLRGAAGSNVVSIREVANIIEMYASILRCLDDRTGL